jgi:hypothetical protein
MEGSGSGTRFQSHRSTNYSKHSFALEVTTLFSATGLCSVDDRVICE